MAIGDPVRINPGTVTIDSVRMILNEGGTPVDIPLTFVSLEYEPGDLEQNEPILSFNIADPKPALTYLSERVSIFSNGGLNAVRDENGTAIAEGTEIWHIIPNIVVPSPTTDTSVGRSDQDVLITFTPPDAYIFSGSISTDIYFDGGYVGSGIGGLDTTTFIISQPNTYELRHSGQYQGNIPWILTETIEILPPIVPFSDKLAVILEGDFPGLITTGSSNPAIDFLVKFITPAQENPDDDSQIDHGTLINAIAIKDVATGATLYVNEPFVSIVRDGLSTTVTYRLVRTFYAGNWRLVALSGVAKDEAGRTVAEEIELARVTVVEYVAGPEQWDPSNPTNPVYPREAPAANSDLIGRIDGGTFIQNMFDLGVDPEVTMGSTGMDAVEDMQLTSDGKLCVTAKVGQEQKWRMQVRHYGQLLRVENEFAIDLGTHNGLTILAIGNNNGDDLPVVTYEGGLTSGNASVLIVGKTTVITFENDPTGTAIIRARNFDLWEIEGNKSTAEGDGSDRAVCVKQTSSARYYEIAVGPRNQQFTTYADGQAVRIPVGRSYWDWQARVIAGNVQAFRVWKDEVEIAPYPGDTFGWIRQNLGGNITYNARIYDLSGNGFATAIAVRTEITLDDGQIFTHSTTFEAAAIRPQGLYFVGGPLPAQAEVGTVISWQIGNAQPPAGTSLVNVSTKAVDPDGSPAFAVSYGSSDAVAATVTFQATLSKPGTYQVEVSYEFSNGETDTTLETIEVTPPPPEPPNPPSLFAAPSYRNPDTGDRSYPLGSNAILIWGQAEFTSRTRTEIFIEISNADFSAQTSQNLSIATVLTSGNLNYIPRFIGVYRARLSITYADWPTAALSEWVEFTAVAPPAPQNLSITPLTNTTSRLQWQEPQIQGDGILATRYYLHVNGGEQVWSGNPTINPSNNSYRYIDFTNWGFSVTVGVSSEWNGVRSPISELIEWTIYSERTFAEMDAGASPDLLAVKNAIAAGPLAETRALAAGDAALAATLNGGQATAAYLNTYLANTRNYWLSVADTTANASLKAVAEANAAWFVGVPSLLDALADCVGNGVQNACTYADSAEGVYLEYLRYVGSQTANTILSIADWIAAGRPTS